MIHLPWEYCFDEKNNQFLGKDIQTPVIRYIPRAYTADPLTAVNKLRILMVLSNPSDVPPLNVLAEEKIMREALGTRLGAKVELEVLTEVTQRRLYRSINSFDPHIIHFVGHGTYEDNQGALVIETDEGTARSLTANQLADLVKGRSVKIVVLNACDTSAAAAGAKAFNSTAVGLVYARVPAVIAMQFRVPDNIALQFTETLYWQIAEGTPLDKAVSEMRLSVSLGDSEDAQVLWGIPTLYMRAPDGQIWATEDGGDSGASTSSGHSGGASSGGGRVAAEPAPAKETKSSTTNQSGGININIGGSGDFSGTVTLGDAVQGDKIDASGGGVVNKVTGDQYNIGGDYIVGGSGKGKKPEKSLDQLIEQIQTDIKPLLSSLDASDAEDATDNLEEAHESAASSTPKGKRIARKLGNTLEILEDNDLDGGVIKQLEKAIKKAREV